MPKIHNKCLLNNAKELRKSATKEENHLWYDYLRKYKIRFTRQKIIGKYIADFYCSKAKLVIELDGSGHYTAEGKQHDIERTEFLKQYGLMILRFSNSDIHDNFDGVCQYIDMTVTKRIAELSKEKA